MHEIDLIPPEHLDQRRLRRWLTWAALLVVCIALTSVALRLALWWGIVHERPIVEQIQRAELAASAQRTGMAELRKKLVLVEAQLSALRQLQQRADWEPALRSVDGAFGPGLWIDRLAFDSALPTTPTRATAPPDSAAPSSPVREQSIEIKGHAVDHTALTSFTRALGDKAELQHVRLIDTGLRRYSMMQVVDFTLAAGVAFTTKGAMSLPGRPNGADAAARTTELAR